VHRPHSVLGWLTPAKFAQTIDPRRDAVLRSRNGSAPQPAATAQIQQPKTAGANSKLDKTWGQVKGHNEHLFTSDQHARQIIEEWGSYYNRSCPHTSRGGLPLMSLQPGPQTTKT